MKKLLLFTIILLGLGVFVPCEGKKGETGCGDLANQIFLNKFGEVDAKKDLLAQVLADVNAKRDALIEEIRAFGYLEFFRGTLGQLGYAYKSKGQELNELKSDLERVSLDSSSRQLIQTQINNLQQMINQISSDIKMNQDLLSAKKVELQKYTDASICLAKKVK